jgi:flagellar hook-length control protein FliK
MAAPVAAPAPSPSSGGQASLAHATPKTGASGDTFAHVLEKRGSNGGAGDKAHGSGKDQKKREPGKKAMATPVPLAAPTLNATHAPKRDGVSVVAQVHATGKKQPGAGKTLPHPVSADAKAKAAGEKLAHLAESIKRGANLANHAAESKAAAAETAKAETASAQAGSKGKGAAALKAARALGLHDQRLARGIDAALSSKPARQSHDLAALTFKPVFSLGGRVRDAGNHGQPSDPSAATEPLGRALPTSLWLTAQSMSAPPSAGPSPVLNQPLGTPAWQSDFAAHVVWLAGHGASSAKLQLNPAHLGPIHVHVEVTQNQAQVVLQADNPATRQAMQSSLGQLQRMFDQQGVALAGAQVFSQGAGAGGHQSAPRQSSFAPRGGAASEGQADHEAAGISTRRVVAVGLLDAYA